MWLAWHHSQLCGLDRDVVFRGGLENSGRAVDQAEDVGVCHPCTEDEIRDIDMVWW
jgi:hypothetical protein